MPVWHRGDTDMGLTRSLNSSATALATARTANQATLVTDLLAQLLDEQRTTNRYLALLTERTLT
jgi:hypothetical protein